MDASLMARLRELEDENRRLKKIYADELLKAESHSWDYGKESDEAISAARDGSERCLLGRTSIKPACMVFGVSITCDRYQPQLFSENAEIADHLIRLAYHQRNLGFGICFLYLPSVNGYRWNQKW